jgi:hypothetical protein
MSRQHTSLIIAGLVALCVVPVAAQQTLGDLVAEGGYDWIIGRWVATTDEGRELEFKYDWALEKRVVLAEAALGEFKYRGMIVLSPVTGEISEVGVDNRGGTWKGTWSEDAPGLAHRIEHTSAEGTVNKGEILYEKAGADSVTIAMYGVDGSGYRNAEPRSKLTYKRRPAAAGTDVSAAGQSDRSRDYQMLGDLVSEGGYEWLIGKWLATEEGRTYELEYKPILDRHAALAEVKIGDFQYSGLIMYVPARQEITQIGADNMGGVWKGTWEQDGGDALHRIEYTGSDATTRKIQHVYSRIDGGGFKVKEYPVEAAGGRAATPRRELTFKPQKPAAESK